MNLFKKKTLPPIPYESETRAPAVRSSICTGEMTLGFVDLADGRFHEYALARTQADVEEFCRRCGIAPEDIRKIY